MSEYKPTLNVTQTAFSMKANLPQNEPRRIKFWDEDGPFVRSPRGAKGPPSSSLHDGPPFANGDIHMGTSPQQRISRTSSSSIGPSRGSNAPFVRVGIVMAAYRAQGGRTAR
jgi:isoleucyl-tRNA synthetase